MLSCLNRCTGAVIPTHKYLDACHPNCRLWGEKIAGRTHISLTPFSLEGQKYEASVSPSCREARRDLDWMPPRAFNSIRVALPCSRPEKTDVTLDFGVDIFGPHLLVEGGSC